jgi:hypothetical protein
MLAATVLRRTGPLQQYIVPLLLLAFVGIVLAVLNAAEMIDFFGIFRRSSLSKTDDFKPITLRRFKKGTMAQIHRCPDSSGAIYVIPATLSAEPPLAWTSAFLAKWNGAHRDRTVRIYRDTIRFSSNLNSVPTVWKQLKSVIAETNKGYTDDLTNQLVKLNEQQRDETNRRAEELKNKWETLKDLS